jgi:hypothetical protein
MRGAEFGESGAGGVEVDRAWWQQKLPPAVLALCDELAKLVTQVTGTPHSLEYHKILINVAANDGSERRIWTIPRQSLARVGAYITKPEDWISRFEEVGLLAAPRRGNKAALVSLTPDAFQRHKSLLTEFIHDSFAEQEIDD